MHLSDLTTGGLFFFSHEADVPISFVHVCSDRANEVSGRVYLSSLVIGSRSASHFQVLNNVRKQLSDFINLPVFPALRPSSN